LGFMFLWGKGVPQDYKEAIKWYLKSRETQLRDLMRIFSR
jgi:TPR repeat protein